MKIPKIPLGCLIATAIGMMICCAILGVSAIVGGGIPTLTASPISKPVSTLDLKSLNTSVALTAWAPVTLTAAAKPTSTLALPPTPIIISLPSSTYAPLPTFVPLIIPTEATYFYIQSTSAPSGHPSGTSGQCVDGTYTYAAHKQGACSHHGGVAYWWGP